MIEETFITTVVERTKNAPWGINDGKTGRANNVQVIKKNGDKFYMPKKSGYKLEKGDKTIVPTICWSTSVWPLIQCGLEPVFVDVGQLTLNADIRQIEKLVELCFGECASGYTGLDGSE